MGEGRAPPVKPPRVGLLFRPGGPWPGGFYYLQNLVLALRSLPDGEQPDLIGFIATGSHVPTEELAPILRLMPYSSPNPRRTARTRARDVLRRVDAIRRSLPWDVRGAARRRPVEVIFPLFEERPAPYAGLPWIPDLQHFHLPEYFSPEERANRTELYRRISERAPLAVVSSRTAARELEDRFADFRGKLRVLHFTTVPRPEWDAVDPQEVARRYGVARPYFMLPNQLWVHKNHLLAFEAMSRLRADGIDASLVCTGLAEDYRHPEHPRRLREFVERQGLADRVLILGVVPREDYVALLRGAAAVLQPSRFEGWSSTVEDARAFGKRLVLSDLPSHREQDPECARYAPADDPEAFAATMREALEGSGAPDEAAALAAQRERVAAYARAFCTIAREAAG
jgi:glycosyltransferase involved in cell wall biosynthesis